MSVLARFRKDSKYKFYVNAIRLRKEITNLLLRDIGVKRTIRNYRVKTDGMEPQGLAGTAIKTTWTICIGG